MFIKAQQSGQFDIVSADALWVPYYYQHGLTEAFDIDSIPVSQQLYSVSRDFSIWQNSAGYLALSACVVGAADLLQPEVRLTRAYLLGGAARSEVQGQVCP